MRQLIILLALYFSISTCFAVDQSSHINPTQSQYAWVVDPFITIANDYKDYYTSDTLLQAGILFGFGGGFANSGFDREIRDKWQEDIRADISDDVLEIFEIVGEEGKYHFPVFLLTALWGQQVPKDTFQWQLGQWGQRSLRTWFIGGPQQLIFMNILGGERPPGDSSWHAFHGLRGISGHAFFGAVPFLSIAFMNDNPWIRYPFFVFSTLPGLARVNGDNHYFSQILLGWGLAYLAEKSIDQRIRKNQAHQPMVQVIPLQDGAYVMASFHY